uniref:Uncharacterized protein n=1 Tax=Oryza brachyantha TaxID=4533 RepID=J3KZJ2_ORYBR
MPRKGEKTHRSTCMLFMFGDPEPVQKVVKKYLRVARPRFSQLVVSTKTIQDVSTLSQEEATRRLKAVEDMKLSALSSFLVVAAKLYLTEEEWIEHQNKKDQEVKVDFMRIRYEELQLLAKIPRGSSQLYMLDITLARLVS